ncbi:MAG: hypothetical protein J0H55_07060 [Chitinophagaceae bacterium]|nr:hypothetical protein [Chitinophagaceae bacterium]
MISKYFKALVMFSILITGCKNSDKSAKKESNAAPAVNENTFSHDQDFLKKWDSSLVVLKAGDSNAMILVSPKYQAKVFTSTARGDSGKSFGWINYGAFEKPVDPHMNAFGGEDRLWLGPEGGPFSLFFAPGKEMVFDNWHTPAPFDIESWSLVSYTTNEARLSKDMKLLNYAGTELHLNINREIRMLETPQIEKSLSIALGKDVHVVGFTTTNTLKNTGNIVWDHKTGAPCMWNLDMFTPSEKTVIVIPYKTNVEGKVATTDYFGEIPADRIKIDSGTLYFRADGHSRGKLGLPPARVKGVAGSYSADKGVLTIIRYDVDQKGTYLNQEWTTKKDPFTGDVMNAYNDGPLKDGSQMGPFYEMESVSPAAFLKPGESLVHKHTVYHFTGDQNALNGISEKVLGVSLDQINSIFKKD